MMLSRVLKSVVLAVSLLSLSPAWAEDIDLFLGLPATEVDAPNVLFIIDNTANWNQPFTAEMAALSSLFEGLPDSEVNVGIMMFTETGKGNNNTDGGYVRAAIRPMNAATKPLYSNLIESFDSEEDKSNSGKAGLTLAEAYLYFSGRAPEAGNGKEKTDFTGNPAVFGKDFYLDSKKIYDLAENALADLDSSPYNSPIADGFCGKNFIIWIGNGAAQDSNNDSKRAKEILEDLNGNSSQISITPSGSASNMADEWARFMAQSPEAITTFTLDINKVETGQGPGWSALLRSMADQSGGKYYVVADDFESIKGALDDVFSRILSVNSVFASVALPASANTQSTFLNQVYIGLFRPDENASSRWFGNLKQYKLGFDGGNVLRVLDADEKAIIDDGTGFVTECARSFWTPEAIDIYWEFLPEAIRRGGCRDVANSQISNYPDGPVVEKGGQAYVTRSHDPATRVVKTCTPSSTGNGCGALTDFNVGNSAVTADLLGAANADERSVLINWGRGADVDDENGNSNTTEMRPSVHGDIIHSQPVAIDFAEDPANPSVVVFYGGNDGLLRAINGNRSTGHSGVEAGQEIWTFMPADFYGQIKRNRENTISVRFPASGINAGTTGAPKPYGVDGPITAYDNGVDRYVYVGLRRGGRSVYALDVSSIESPQLLWRRGCPNLGDDIGCSTGWSNIGQTWSPLNVTTVTDDPDPVIIMGGGYDGCEDYDDGSTTNHQCTATSKGNSIYIIDGVNGALLQTFATERPVVGQVTIVPESDLDRNIRFAYAADTGGNIYRISGAAANAPIFSTPPSGWTITRVAAFGCGPTAVDTCSSNRKFLYGPDVVRVQRNVDEYGLMVGSGDREKPSLDYGAAANVENFFFGLIDRPLVTDWLEDPASGSPDHCGADMACLDTLTAVTTGGPVNADNPVGEKGWKLTLSSTEQVVSGALTVADVVNFSTQIPATNDGSCNSTNLGTATTYNIGFDSGEGETVNIIGGGLVPTPVAGKVILDSGLIVPFCIGCGGEGSAIGGSQVSSSVDWIQHKSRVYWNIEK